MAKRKFFNRPMMHCETIVYNIFCMSDSSFFLVTGRDHRPFWRIVTIKILKYTFFWRFIRLHSGVFCLSFLTICVLRAHSRQDACKTGSAKNVKTLWKLCIRESNSKWFMKSNQYGHVSLANARKLSNSHTNYLSAINFSCFNVVVEAINK